MFFLQRRRHTTQRRWLYSFPCHRKKDRKSRTSSATQLAAMMAEDERACSEGTWYEVRLTALRHSRLVGGDIVGVARHRGTRRTVWPPRSMRLSMQDTGSRSESRVDTVEPYRTRDSEFKYKTDSRPVVSRPLGPVLRTRDPLTDLLSASWPLLRLQGASHRITDAKQHVPALCTRPQSSGGSSECDRGMRTVARLSVVDRMCLPGFSAPPGPRGT